MKLKFKPWPKPAGIRNKFRTGARLKQRRLAIKPVPRRKGDLPPPRIKYGPDTFRCVFLLSLKDFRILQICLEDLGLEPGSYSQALQTILREWKAFKDQGHHAVASEMPPKTGEGGAE
jgi:hypothetical protein